MNRKMLNARRRKSNDAFFMRFDYWLNSLKYRIAKLKAKEYISIDTRENNILVFLCDGEEIKSIEVARNLFNLFCHKIEKEGFVNAE